MSTIGTAGHIDHGKSTLVQALTGMDPDRLPEEKTRGMTIDLGFAWLQLPGGQEVSIIDVPGHEGFIKNMLAGVGGIDAALFVVAADEGVMPQTREHLAILDLLGVQCGIVALTKADLVDAEWLELVREEVTTHLRPTTLAHAPIVPVSAYTGQGLPELLTHLERVLALASERQNVARPRLPIDRVFSMAGFGTVVTGTLLDGVLKVGQEVEVAPQHVKTRIRALQTHKHSIEVAQPGTRVAINLANISRSELARGDVVVLPGQIPPTLLIDARLRLLPDASHALAHNTLVDFYCGTQEIMARVRLLDTQELSPGQSAWIQLRLSRPAVLARRDRFILRIPSPSTTIGGGQIIDAQPRFHRRFLPSLLDQLATLERGTPAELALAVLHRKQRPAETQVAASTTSREKLSLRPVHAFAGFELTTIVAQTHLPEDVARQALESLSREDRALHIGAYWFAQSAWEALAATTQRLLSDYHRRYPLRAGLPKEEWRSNLNLPLKLTPDICTALQAQGVLRDAHTIPGSISLPDFLPSFTPLQQQHIGELLQKFQQRPYTPPDRTEAEALVGADVLAALIEQRQLVKLGDGVLFSQHTYNEALTRLLSHLREHGTLTVAEARNLLGATRKYIVPLLEHMDALKLTRRLGDERVLGTTAFNQR